MANVLNSSHFQHQALAGQLTPPPSPENKVAEVVRHAANTGKLRRSRTPEALLLVGSNYEVWSKHLARTNSKLEKESMPPSPMGDSRPATKACTYPVEISPLSPDFETKLSPNEPRPELQTPIESKSKDSPAPPSRPEARTPNLARTSSLKQPPNNGHSQKAPSKSNADKAAVASQSGLPPLVAAKRHSTLQRPVSGKVNLALEKELPPPPPTNFKLHRSITQAINPDDFGVPEDSPRIKYTQDRALRKVKSIGSFNRTPKTPDTFCVDFRPGTSSIAKANRPFHKRLSIGRRILASFTIKSSSSLHNNRISMSKFTRRMSHISRPKDLLPEDPLAPVFTLPVMTNHEDVIGGLTYLPRYTNNFAGFCKSAWRLQVSDPKSFDIKHRNSTSQSPTLKCSKCSFEGPLHPQRVRGDRYVWARIPDSKVYSSFGVTYTWQFLFKSHFAQKKGTKGFRTPMRPLSTSKAAQVDMAEELFGCIFCCVQGHGTPVFKGPEALSWHIRSHVNDRINDVELQHRFKIIVGREPEFNEKFDLHIPRLRNTSSVGASLSVHVGGDGQWEGPGKFNEQRLSSRRTSRATDQLTTGVTTPPPMPILSIQNEKSWEVKTEGGAGRVHKINGDDTGTWVKHCTPFFKPIQ